MLPTPAVNSWMTAHSEAIFPTSWPEVGLWEVGAIQSGPGTSWRAKVAAY